MNKRQQKEFRPNWQEGCDNCGQTPTVGESSGLCGPCYFGTHEAVNGGWWDDSRNDFNDDFVEEHIPASRR